MSDQFNSTPSNNQESSALREACHELLEKGIAIISANEHAIVVDYSRLNPANKKIVDDSSLPLSYSSVVSFPDSAQEELPIATEIKPPFKDIVSRFENNK